MKSYQFALTGIATGLMLTLTGCNQPASTSQNTEASTTASTTPTTQTTNLSTPSYKVIVDAEYPPYDFRDEKGNAMGFDVDILNAIAKNQGFNITVVPMPWNTVMPKVADGSYDIGMGGMSPGDIEDEGFADKITQSYAYAYGIDTIASISPIITDYQSLKNYKVATLADSAYIADMKELMGANTKANLTETKTVFLGYQKLVNGEVDAVLADKGVLAYFVKQHPLKTADKKVNIDTKGFYFDRYYPMTIISKKDNPELAQKINKGIEAVVKDGTYAKIHQQWFGRTPKVLPKPEPIPLDDSRFVPVPSDVASAVKP
ncbi:MULTISPECIES: substrate-binding periplasmic protein [unclassified Moraxella]|uniref:substrate-binding periplasmic protein n=1 Tax=unclassified Moraxella TaxID=2685852 RepID=UPI003AF8BD72